MQSKGAIKLVTVLLILACLYQLSFTWVTSRTESKAKTTATKQSEAIIGNLTNAGVNVSESHKEAIKDSIEIAYLDSVSTNKVYPLGLFTYRECKEKEVLLGLDLKGGMNVMLEVSVGGMLEALAGNNAKNADFQKAISLANQKQHTSGKDYLSLFNEAWNEIAPDKKLSSLFGTYEMRERINANTSNDEVMSIIRTETNAAISNAFNVLRNRIDRFGVVSPNIQRVGNSGRILIELPGVKDPERVRKLLQGTASLEFWETFDCRSEGITQYIVNVDKRLKEINDAKKVLSGDTTQVAQGDSIVSEEQAREMYPLLSILSLNQDVDQNGKAVSKACVGRAHYKDTARINQILNMPEALALKQGNLRWGWTHKAVDQAGVVYELIALKLNPRYSNEAPLSGDVVIDARKQFDQMSGSSYPTVSMTMNNEGAKIWAQLTKNNVGREIAVVLDGYIYSYPNVNNEITGGRSEISGRFTTQDADDLVNVLSSGKMPAPVRIVQEAVVGPTLGKESINSGMISFLIAFALILIYLIIFYNTAGLAADVALIVNVLLIFGTLASFGAVLTLPGIAGIVLTLGMAIDANIIIYERIKEELAGGKALRLSVADGYKNAYSAIIDGQVTTLFTGIVLLIFGTGPIRGFATTLIIGIITSLFTSIFITRLIFEWFLNRNKNIKFGFPWSLKFLKGTKIDFLGKRKYSFTVAAVVAALCLLCIFTKGFSYGVDFTGGRTYVVCFDKSVKSNEIREALMSGMVIEEGEQHSIEVKQFGPTNQMKITTQYKYADQSENVDHEVEVMLYNALKNSFEKEITFDEFISTQTNPNGIISSEKVGPTIASDITRGAILAVIIALFVIFIYIAIRFLHWEWGLGGVVGLISNTIFTLGLFSLGAGLFPWTMDIDTTFIAAILTIIGYSINDTVIVFDRIRENRRNFPKRDLKENINDAINATLTRTVNTSFSTLLVLLPILLFGGDVIRGFAFALSAGILVGTLSSLFIATPVSFEMLKRKSNKQNTVKPELLKK